VLNGKRVLVVDDDLGIRRLARIVLTREGCAVDEARNGHEAILAINERRYDAMVLDLMMPVLSGVEVIHHLEEAGIRRPFVVMMSAASERELSKISSEVVHSVVRKPFDLGDLVRAVNQCIRSQIARSSDNPNELQQHSN
jgi:DNA-binding response OmpR family regulator